MSKINPENFNKIISNEDSGFGSNYKGIEDRLLNHKGGFNIQRIGEGSISIFHEILQLSWKKMLLLILLFYIFINLLFAAVYYFIGPEGISGIQSESEWGKFLQCYFFSVQTFTTVGYGGMHPINWKSSTVAGFEALSGLLTFAIITGLVYSKFSKPNFKFKFSENLLITPYKDITGAMFRVVNSNRQRLMDVEATMIFTLLPDSNNNRIFRTLDLEIKKLSMFPLSWTVNHPINEQSPLFQLTREDMDNNKAEILVIISAYDEESGRILKEIHSYHHTQFCYNAKFNPMVDVKSGVSYLYLDKISEITYLH